MNIHAMLWPLRTTWQFAERELGFRVDRRRAYYRLPQGEIVCVVEVAGETLKLPVEELAVK